MNPAPNNAPVSLPSWAREIIALYESDAASQFILYGNVQDRFVLPLQDRQELASLTEFFLQALMPRFDVVLSYDLGNGITIEKGGEHFSKWPALKEIPDLPRQPRPAVEALTRYFRYAANLARLGRERLQIGCVIKSAHLVAPAIEGGLSYDLSALALLMRDWSTDPLLAAHSLVTVLLAENLNDLHPLIATNPRAARLKVPLPSGDEVAQALDVIAPRHPTAVSEFKDDLPRLASQFAGVTLHGLESLLKRKDYEKTPLQAADLVRLKKQLVEEESQGLIEFVESGKTLDDLHGQDTLKAWLRQDFALWNKNDLRALPMGYLICGPVGTGKTYMVQCLAGEAGVPVVKIKNFRDKWVGSTEGNLEKIFRLLQALNRCFVFIDEADQSLGKRDSGSNDAGLSGRIYSMIAQEMSNPANRGRIIWVLASSRPDLIEVDLKRPGRVDVKIPIFPTATQEESFGLIRALCKRYDLAFEDSDVDQLRDLLPILLTPGAAEALAVKVYRSVRTEDLSPLAALREALTGYQNPVPVEILEHQIRLAVQEASDLDFVPEAFRKA